MSSRVAGGWEVHFVETTPIQHFMGGTAGGPQAGFVLRHYLRNMTFSLLSNLSIHAFSGLCHSFLRSVGKRSHFGDYFSQSAISGAP
ncbi:MAG: hypothetical protein WDN00_06825 [Limisphaerales bacterium]